MTLTKLRNYTLIILLVAGGLAFVSRGDDGGKAKPDNDDEVQVAFEVEAHPPTNRGFTSVGIVADLGSAGHFEAGNAKVYSAQTNEARVWRHTFKAKRGDQLFATINSNEGPLFDFNCYFYQKGFGGDPDLRNRNGWGDISQPAGPGGSPRAKTQCRATVR